MRTGAKPGKKGRRKASDDPTLTPLQRYILAYLEDVNASYAQPVRSVELARQFNITDSYARGQARALVLKGLVAVRGGPKGGYYLVGNPTPQHLPREDERPGRANALGLL
ncbi:MAG: Rrf2 family transcriptional regulator [Bacillota bacterium]